MTTNHIDQLTQWWETAERGAIQKGDTVIERETNGQYRVFTAPESDDEAWDEFRILSRAPKPKPAWHDAKAVTAVTKKHPEFRDVWVSDCGEWRNVDGDFIDADDLRDVTPLIEAKVTDEMVKRAEDWYAHSSVLNDPVEDVLGILTAALGLETA